MVAIQEVKMIFFSFFQGKKTKKIRETKSIFIKTSKMKQEDKFSDDPLENIKIENDFLKLKLKAQYGDAFLMGGNEKLPPEIENRFLKNIIAIEEAHQHVEYTTVYETMGKPGYKLIQDLKPGEIADALHVITTAMERKGILLNFCDGPYPDEVIYQFITEELFGHEIEKEPLPGMTCNFIYEEFHPNDKAEIEKNTHRFLRHWFTQSFDEYSSELDYHFITADARQLSQEAFFDKMKHFFDAFTAFKDDGYTIDHIKFELHDDGRGLGHAEGMLKYDAVLENGETVHFEGPYILYMRREDKCWSIFYFVMPGFAW